MTPNNRIHINSKWDKTQTLLRNRQLRSYVPETRRLDEGSLRQMLLRYSMVYIKPVSGTFGNGVMRVEKHGEARGVTYSYHYLDKKHTFRSFDDLYRSILQNKWKRPYLVQKGIQLLTHHGRRFDIRVMVQKNKQNEWEATGMIGRVAQPGKIVTNYHSGGKPADVPTLLKPYLKNNGLAEFEKVLARLGKTAATALSQSYPGINMVGADIGVDSAFKPWIIELNTHPDPYIFKHLKNPQVFRKVLAYAKALGRIPSVKTRKTNPIKQVSGYPYSNCRPGTNTRPADPRRIRRDHDPGGSQTVGPSSLSHRPEPHS